MRKHWYLLIPFAILFLVRCYLPADSGETYLTHNAIAESIAAGHKWGLLALVNIMDVPLLPTLALVVAQFFRGPLQLAPVAIVCAFAQAALAVTLVCAVPKRHRYAPYAVAALLASIAIPFFRNLLATDDVNWISVLPLTAALLSLNTYRETRELRTLIVIAVCLGVLVFCGPALLLTALAILISLSLSITKTAADQRQGHLFVLWSPFIYALILWLPWYSGSEDNFMLRFISALADSHAADYHLPFAPQIPLAAAVTSFILALKTKDNLQARCLLPVFIVLPLAAAVSNATHLSPVGVGPALTVCSAVLAINAFDQVSLSPKTPQIAACLALIAIIVMGCRHPFFVFQLRALPAMVLRETNKLKAEPPDLFDYRDAPDRNHLILLADQQWKGSRVVLVGKRLVKTVYPDPKQVNFHPLESFDPEAFRKHAAYEQLHLLVPPPDGRFYPPESPLNDIHAHGAPYLFLVAQFPHGWQLWRSLPEPTEPPPQTEAAPAASVAPAAPAASVAPVDAKSAQP